ncbi:MAG: FAD-dependent monooxygenase [Planctomycetes bacterium]|nr:FAD-dependent monooxygenase [Planctomycetota bacterium]
MVIGAGPAGSAAAYACCAIGLRTLIVERATFPRDKVCGGCLSPSGMASLAEMGLAQSVRRVASPIHSFTLAAGNQSLAVRLDHQGIAVGRDVLDSLLLEHAVARGAIACRGASATLIDEAPDGCRLNVSEGSSSAVVTADVVVVADGLAGTFLPREGHWKMRTARRSHFGVGTRLVEHSSRSLCDPGEISMRCGGVGYFGAVRLSDGSIDIAAALSPEETRRLGGPGRAIRQLACESGASAHAETLERARWRGTPLLTRRRNVESDRIFVVGDAAGYVEPFTGEGMSWGLAAGLAVARHARARLQRTYNPGEWTLEWAQLAQRRRLACKATAIALRSPTILAASIMLANAVPSIAGVLSRAISGPWSLRASEPTRA